MRKFKVLLSNDDGVEAPGLWMLYKEMASVADVTVVAPSSERSATGHGISVFNQLSLKKHLREEEEWGYGLDGTPADCVKMALSVIMKDNPPDLVISGINRGQNMGTSVIYSGTVAAALEATMYGFPAIAVSLGMLELTAHNITKLDKPDLLAYLRTLGIHPEEYSVAAGFAKKIALETFEQGLPKGVFLNVNVPNVKHSEIKGIKITSMGHSAFTDNFQVIGSMGEETLYKNQGGPFLNSSAENVVADDNVFSDKFVSITPLHYDWTDYNFMKKLSDWNL